MECRGAERGGLIGTQSEVGINWVLIFQKYVLKLRVCEYLPFFGQES